MAKTFYLYYTTKNTPNIVKLGLITSQQGKIIAVDTSIFSTKNKLIEIQQDMQLKRFEVCQRDFEVLIEEMSYFDIRVTDIRFNYELLEDESEELRQYIGDKNNKELIKFIQNQKVDLDNEIDDITFILNRIVGRQPICINFKNKAIMNVNIDLIEEIDSVLNLNVIKVLCGTYIY